MDSINLYNNLINRISKSVKKSIVESRGQYIDLRDENPPYNISNDPLIQKANTRKERALSIRDNKNKELLKQSLDILFNKICPNMNDIYHPYNNPYNKLIIGFNNDNDKIIIDSEGKRKYIINNEIVSDNYRYDGVEGVECNNNILLIKIFRYNSCGHMAHNIKLDLNTLQKISFSSTDRIIKGVLSEVFKKTYTDGFSVSFNEFQEVLKKIYKTILKTKPRLSTYNKK